MTPLDVMQRQLAAGLAEAGGKNRGPGPAWACERWLSASRWQKLLDDGDAEWCTGAACSSYDDAGGRYQAAIQHSVDVPDRRPVRVASLSSGTLLERLLAAQAQGGPWLLIDRNRLASHGRGEDANGVVPQPSDILILVRPPGHAKGGRAYHVEIVESASRVNDLPADLLESLGRAYRVEKCASLKMASPGPDDLCVVSIGGNSGPKADRVARNVRLLRDPRVGYFARMRP